MRQILGTAVTLGAIAFILLLAVAYGGCVDVAATGDDPAGVHWFLETTRHSAVESGADGVDVPTFTDAMRTRGLRHFDDTCVHCHGGPGVSRAEWAEGLNPSPPGLAGEADEPAEVFWITRHGIRMTGMPAFGPSHSEHDIWSIVAFVSELPTVTPADYERRLQAAASDTVGGHHSH